MAKYRVRVTQTREYAIIVEAENEHEAEGQALLHFDGPDAQAGSRPPVTRMPHYLDTVPEDRDKRVNEISAVAEAAGDEPVTPFWDPAEWLAEKEHRGEEYREARLRADDPNVFKSLEGRSDEGG